MSREASSGIKITFAAASLAAAACAWICLELFLRRLPPSPSVLYGGPHVEQIMARWAPCFEVERRDGADVIAVSAVHARNLNFKSSPSFPYRKPPGTFRVAVVGESSAVGVADQLERITAGYPNIEVLQCADGGANAAQMERRWDEVTHYSPDAVVVMFGHNLTYSQPYLPRWRYRLNRFLSRSRVIVEAAHRLSPRVAPVPPGTHLFAYESFLQRAARESAARGQTLVLCTVPSNWRFPPPADTSLTADPAFLQAEFEHWRGDDRSSAHRLLRLANKNDGAFAHFVAGDRLFQEGDLPGARAQLRMARNRYQANTVMANDATRRVARAARTPLIETEDLFAGKMSDGIPGWNMLRDRVHLNQTHNALLVWECLKAFREAPAAAAVALTLPSDDKTLDALKIAVSDSLQSSSSFSGASGTAPVEFLVAEHLREHPRQAEAAIEFVLAGLDAPSDGVTARARAGVWLAVARGFWRAGRRKEAFAFSAEARRRDPDWADPDFQDGLFQVRLGHDGTAARLFENALRLEPGRADIRFFLQRLKS